jgi:BolA protein
MMPIMVRTPPADKARSRIAANEGEMNAADRIRGRLTEAFTPSELQVIDESDRHKGHAGARPEGETHFRVRIVAEAFRGKNRVETHRLVNAALGAEFAGGLHALAIEAKAPAEKRIANSE